MDERIAQIKARAEAATPGPWHMATKPEYDGEQVYPGHWVGGATGGDEYDHNGGIFRVDETVTKEMLEQGYDDVEQICNPWDENDAAFIAHAREDIPWLLDRLAAVEQERDALLTRLADEHAVADREIADAQAQARRLAEAADEAAVHLRKIVKLMQVIQGATPHDGWVEVAPQFGREEVQAAVQWLEQAKASNPTA